MANKILLAVLLFALSSWAFAQSPAQYGWGRDLVGSVSGGSITCQPFDFDEVIQVAHSGVYNSLLSDGTAFDLSIRAGYPGFDLYVTVREANGQWFEGAANIGPSDRGLFIPLISASGEHTRWMTLCSTQAGADCKRLRAAVWRQDGQPNTTPILTPFIATRSHNGAFCVP